MRNLIVSVMSLVLLAGGASALADRDDREDRRDERGRSDER